MNEAEGIEVLQGDITRLEVDVVVNAANNALAGGGGVDGAIHRAAGPALYRACRDIGGCPTGEVRITAGFGLPAGVIFHTVGPVWRGGAAGEAGLLAACYRNCLQRAQADGHRSIAFPAISCGVYGYPPAQAVAIACAEARAALARPRNRLRVLFCCFDADIAALYEAELAR